MARIDSRRRARDRNPAGTIHLVAMFYTVLDGALCFWAYASHTKLTHSATQP